MNKPTISPKALNQLRRKAMEAAQRPKPQMYDSIFSQSHDVSEERDMRQVKMTLSSQMFPHLWQLVPMKSRIFLPSRQ
jgi:hypothetical protein